MGFLERYIVEQLLNAKLSHCIGGLTSDPLKRAAWVFTLNEIHDHDCIGSMLYGDTISFGIDIDQNRGLVAEYLMWDIITQLECPTGNAALPPNGRSGCFCHARLGRRPGSGHAESDERAGLSGTAVPPNPSGGVVDEVWFGSAG
jgi:hypothetical protein